MSTFFNSDGVLYPMGGPKRVSGVLPSVFGTDVMTRVELTGGEFDATFDNLTVNGTLTASALSTDSVAPAITAKAGGGQDATLALSKNLNIVTTVATAADSVTLPSAVVGLRVTIVNLGANALAVFPYTSDSINDAAADASVTINPEATVTFNCYTTVLWETTDEATNVFDKLYIGGDVVLAKEVNHNYSVTDTSTAATAGGVIAFAAGKGGTSGAGGNFTAVGGVGGTTGTGGNATLTSGAGGTTSGASGLITVASGVATNATTGTAGATGLITIETGAGGASSGAAGIGADSGGISILIGAGGASSSATGGAVGRAGALTITQGNGGASAGTGISGGAVIASTITLGNGGASTHAAGGAGGSGGALTITMGNGGAVTDAAQAGGVGGSLTLVAGNAGAGSTAGSAGGAVVITAGNGVGTGGGAGNITLTPGTSSTTDKAPVTILAKGVVNKYTDTSVATGATATAIGVVGGHLSVTGATGNVTLPTAAQLTTAIGATPVGTTIEFVVNTVGMTAGNVCTIVVGANIVTQKMISAGDSATDQLLTVTNTSNVNMGIFRICYITATTCSLHRIG